MNGTNKTACCGQVDPARICTSHVERGDLTVRIQDGRTTRSTNAFRKKWDNHRASMALHVADFNFCRVPMTLKTTPAVAAGLESQPSRRLRHEDGSLRQSYDLSCKLKGWSYPPAEQIIDDTSGPMVLMMAIMELSRGHSESTMKSERCAKAWAKKKERATEGEVLTGKVPAWLKVVGGKIVEWPDAVAVIRRIFALAVAGDGGRVIAAKLNAEGVPGIGPSGKWDDAYVRRVLTSRAVIGVFQPMRGSWPDRSPDGPEIPDYFPRVIDDQLFFAAQAALHGRRSRGGRPYTAFVNPFAGLLRDATDGGPVYLHGRMDRGRQYHVLHPGKAVRGLVKGKGTAGSRGVTVSFPYESFEQSILSELRELTPADVLPAADGAGDAAAELALEGKLSDLDVRLTKIKSRMMADDDLDGLIDVVWALDADRRATLDRLAEVQREAASPLAGAWGECPNLADMLASASDQTDARTRMRAALRRTVEGVWCLFVGRGGVRLAAVRVQFVGGRHREYLIIHRAADNAGRPASSAVRSFASIGAGPLDLRKPKDAAKLAKALEWIDL